MNIGPSFEAVSGIGTHTAFESCPLHLKNVVWSSSTMQHATSELIGLLAFDLLSCRIRWQSCMFIFLSFSGLLGQVCSALLLLIKNMHEVVFYVPF
jgi:hypothetical protein